MRRLLILVAVMSAALFVWKADAATETGYRTAQATTLKQCPKGYYWDRATVMCRRVS